jgi:hypothetical protein
MAAPLFRPQKTAVEKRSFRGLFGQCRQQLVEKLLKLSGFLGAEIHAVDHFVGDGERLLPQSGAVPRQL